MKRTKTLEYTSTDRKSRTTVTLCGPYVFFLLHSLSKYIKVSTNPLTGRHGEFLFTKLATDVISSFPKNITVTGSDNVEEWREAVRVCGMISGKRGRTIPPLNFGPNDGYY